jgi:hypothetical protein
MLELPGYFFLLYYPIGRGLCVACNTFRAFILYKLQEDICSPDEIEHTKPTIGYYVTQYMNETGVHGCSKAGDRNGFLVRRFVERKSVDWSPEKWWRHTWHKRLVDILWQRKYSLFFVSQNSAASWGHNFVRY